MTIRDGYFMQLESPAAMRYQVHELRQQILETTDDIEAI